MTPSPSVERPHDGSFCTSDALLIVKGWVELTPRNTLIEFTYRKHYLCLDCHERWDTRKAALEHLLTAQDRRTEEVTT